MPATLNHWPAQPDPLVGEDPVDAQPLRAATELEHRDRLAGGPRVEPAAARERRC